MKNGFTRLDGELLLMPSPSFHRTLRDEPRTAGELKP